MCGFCESLRFSLSKEQNKLTEKINLKIYQFSITIEQL